MRSMSQTKCGEKMTTFTQITLEKADGVATITLNRPEKLNAYTRTMGA